MSDEPRVIRLTAEQARAIVDPVKKAKQRKAILSIVLMLLGCVLLAVAAGFIFGTIWASCAIIGLVVLTIGVLLGTNG